MVVSIAKEMEEGHWKQYGNADQEPPIIETIYFGGGTPSLLSEQELKLLSETLHQTFNIAEQAEITLETNPDDHTAEQLQLWKSLGVNRLSIGVQSFFEQDLQWMNRAHNANQSIACINAAREVGFDNLTIDLIYGIPGLTDEQWKKNFDTAIALGITHLSCYALTVEPKTALEVSIDKGRLQPVDAEQQARQFLLLMDWAKEAGFEHYEISNFAKLGHRSKHNSAYWQGKPYFGFGPSAHSFDGNKTRWWNVANNALYQQAIQQRLPFAESETLTSVQQLNEYIMTALRTIEGVFMNDERWGNDESTQKMVLVKAEVWQSQGKLLIQDNVLKLTNEGKLFADGIAADLFVE